MNIHPSAYEFILPFGDYKGKSFGYVREVDRGYLEWILTASGIPKLYKIAAHKTLNSKSIANLGLDPKPPYPTGKASLFVVNKQKGIVGCTFPYDEELKERFKRIADGAKWNKSEYRWEFSKVHLHPVLKLFKSTVDLNADSGVKTWFLEILQHKKRLDDIRNKQDSDIEIHTLLPLYGYQKVAVEFGIEAGGRFLDADAMGLGKTPTAIGFSVYVGGKTLIVCPKNVKIQWQEMITLFAGKESCIWSGQGFEGDYNADYHIVNYDNVHKHVNEYRKIGFKTLICDEATKLKNYKTIRYKALFGSWKERKKYPGLKIDNVVFLTGTPMLNNPMELYTLLSVLDKDRFNNPFNFMQRYGGRNQKVDPDDLLELHERVKDLMIRRTKSQVRSELKKGRFPIYIELEPNEKKEYEKALDALFKKWRVNGRPSAATMPIVRNILFEFKFPRIVEFIEEMLDSGRPILVFTIQQAHAERIAKHFSTRSRLITGKVSSDKKRRQAVQDIIDGKADVMVMTLIAGGMGTDGLQHKISDALFVDRWFVPGDHEQAEDRINRIGQKEPTQMWYLTVKGTYDEDMAVILSEKQRIIDAAVDGKLPEDSDEVQKARFGSIFGELVNIMAAKRRMQFDSIDDDVVLDD